MFLLQLGMLTREKTMRNCNNCLENDWSFERIEDIVRANCNQCSNEVEFAAKKKMESTDDPCRKCEGELYWKTAKLTNKRKRRNYHYCKWLKCKGCGTPYMDDQFKTLKGDDCQCE